MGSSNAFIGRFYEGSLVGVYCHWNGQPENVGFLLSRYYRSDERINELLNLGDISCLGKGPSLEDGTEAYARDLGEEFLAPSAQAPARLQQCCKHIYAWDGERWNYRKHTSENWVALNGGN